MNLSAWCPSKARHCGARNVVRERIELEHSLEVGFSLLEVCEVICISRRAPLRIIRVPTALECERILKSWNPDASFHYAVNWIFGIPDVL